jgi:hypothetical protein
MFCPPRQQYRVQYIPFQSITTFIKFYSRLSGWNLLHNCWVILFRSFWVATYCSLSTCSSLYLLVCFFASFLYGNHSTMHQHSRAYIYGVDVQNLKNWSLATRIIVEKYSRMNAANWNWRLGNYEIFIFFVKIKKKLFWFLDIKFKIMLRFFWTKNLLQICI